MNTTTTKVKSDKNVDKATVLAMLSDIFFGEYIFATRKVKTADGMEVCINITPASTPDRLKNLTKPNPTIGPIKTLVSEYINVSLKEKTLRCDRAIPRDIKTKKIAEYPIKKVAFSKNFGEGIS